MGASSTALVKNPEVKIVTLQRAIQDTCTVDTITVTNYMGRILKLEFSGKPCGKFSEKMSVFSGDVVLFWMFYAHLNRSKILPRSTRIHPRGQVAPRMFFELAHSAGPGSHVIFRFANYYLKKNTTLQTHRQTSGAVFGPLWRRYRSQ